MEGSRSASRLRYQDAKSPATALGGDESGKCVIQNSLANNCFHTNYSPRDCGSRLWLLRSAAWSKRLQRTTSNTEFDLLHRVLFGGFTHLKFSGHDRGEDNR